MLKQVSPKCGIGLQDHVQMFNGAALRTPNRSTGTWI